jgi:sugar-specific transcriptional regulator TrmB
MFEDIGLTKREIKVYLALLEIGSTTIGNILDKTGIPSSKIYEILKKLQNKGLVSYVKIENKRHYQAADPKTILNILDEKRTRISELMPALLAKQKLAGRKQSVEIFEGKKAIFNLLRNLISDAKPREPYFAFTHGEEHREKTVRLFYKNFIKRRMEKKLDLRLLINRKNKPIFTKHYTQKEFKDSRVRFTAFNFPQGITIFRNMIIIVTWKGNPTAIKIESRQISQEFKEFFLGIWKISKR